jgi:phage terminase small subunit
MASKKSMGGHRLNERQRAFINHYIATGMNATQAAEKAGYSKKTARFQGHELLTNPYVKKELDKRITQILTDTENLSIKWLNKTMAIAGFDIRKAADWNEHGVSPKSSSEIDEATAFAIQEVSSTQTESGTNIKIKSYDKAKALDLLGKFLGIVGGESFALKIEESTKQDDPSALTPEQRRERIAELQRKLAGNAN